MSRKSFFHYFPAPKYMTMPALGLDIAFDAVRYVELKSTHRGLRVGLFGEYPLSGVFSTTEEFLENPELKTILLKIQKDTGFDFAHVSIPEEKAYVFKTEVPELARNEIRNNLELRLEENVPISAGEAVFDYTILHRKQETGPLDVSVTAIPRAVMSRYVELCRSVKIVPMTFRIDAQAIARAVVPEGDETTAMIINFGELKTGLFIVREGVVHFSSTLSIGGDSLTTAIKKSFSVDTETAKKMKRDSTLTKDKKTNEIFSSAMGTLSILRDEINRLLAYWRTYKEKANMENPLIDRIILCGRDATLPGFVEYLQSASKTPIVLGNVWENVASVEDYIPPISFADSLAYAGAVGLALPENKED